MNKLRGPIIGIESSEGLSIVEIDAGGVSLSCIVLETHETSGTLQPGHEIYAVFKESSVSIGKNLSGMLSQRNRLPVRVKSVEKGKILTKVLLDFHGTEIVTIITTRSAKAMEIEPGDEVQAIVKSSDIALMEVEDQL